MAHHSVAGRGPLTWSVAAAAVAGFGIPGFAHAHGPAEALFVLGIFVGVPLWLTATCLGACIASWIVRRSPRARHIVAGFALEFGVWASVPVVCATLVYAGLGGPAIPISAGLGIGAGALNQCLVWRSRRPRYALITPAVILGSILSLTRLASLLAA